MIENLHVDCMQPIAKAWASHCILKGVDKSTATIDVLRSFTLLQTQREGTRDCPAEHTRKFKTPLGTTGSIFMRVLKENMAPAHKNYTEEFVNEADMDSCSNEMIQRKHSRNLETTVLQKLGVPFEWAVKYREFKYILKHVLTTRMSVEGPYRNRLNGWLDAEDANFTITGWSLPWGAQKDAPGGADKSGEKETADRQIFARLRATGIPLSDMQGFLIFKETLILENEYKEFDVNGLLMAMFIHTHSWFFKANEIQQMETGLNRFCEKDSSDSDDENFNTAESTPTKEEDTTKNELARKEATQERLEEIHKKTNN